MYYSSNIAVGDEATFICLMISQCKRHISTSAKRHMKKIIAIAIAIHWSCYHK